MSTNRLLIPLLFLLLLSSSFCAKNKGTISAEDRKLHKMREDCKLTKCSYADTEEMVTNCLNFCISKECFLSTGISVEIGEIDKEKERLFGICVKKILREQKDN